MKDVHDFADIFRKIAAYQNNQRKREIFVLPCFIKMQMTHITPNVHTIEADSTSEYTHAFYTFSPTLFNDSLSSSNAATFVPVLRNLCPSPVL